MQAVVWLSWLSAGTTGVRAHCMKTGVEGEVSVVYVTVPAPGAEDVAKTLAGSIIENKLAACVNILPGLLIPESCTLLAFIYERCVEQEDNKTPPANQVLPYSVQQPGFAS